MLGEKDLSSLSKEEEKPQGLKIGFFTPNSRNHEEKSDAVMSLLKFIPHTQAGLLLVLLASNTQCGKRSIGIEKKICLSKSSAVKLTN